MKIGKPILILGILLILIGAGYMVFTNSVVNKADKLMEKIIKYKIPAEELSTGKYVDFSTDKNEFTKAKIEEGIIFKDEDDKVFVLSNIKIDGLYCVYGEETHCSLFNKKDTGLKEVVEYNEYKIGEAVTLKDGTKWHIIHNSDKYSKYVVLLRDERVDVNGDGFTVDTSTVSDPDRIPFDKNKNKKYDSTLEGNIGYYIENTYKPSLTQISNINEIRLLTSLELEALRDAIGFDGLTEEEIQNMMQVEDELLESIEWMYYSPRPVERLKDIRITQEQYNKLMPHWLYNASSGNYWVINEKGKPITAVWSGDGYTTPKPTTGYSLKPVIIINKENLQ